MIHFDWTISLGSLIFNLPTLIIVIRLYGDWRVVNERLNILWTAHLRRRGLIERKNDT